MNGLRWPKWPHITVLVLGLILMIPALAGAVGEQDADEDAQSSVAQDLEQPAQPVDTEEEEEDDAGPDLDQSVIVKVIRSHMPAIKHCYSRELQKDPDLAGVVTVRFTVGPKGSVTAAEVLESTLENEDVEKCAVSEIRTWIFPEPRRGRPVNIRYPFNFKSSS